MFVDLKLFNYQYLALLTLYTVSLFSSLPAFSAQPERRLKKTICEKRDTISAP